ncbi:SET domain-containing protein [Saitoella complicata NRRL Y-17804]|uniref:Histone-lysine N-methyltransferase n=1 Tax=Saitoella complicata (strain BCRC 22490 / CBS 7301 / JCM 7358 / NBRC 10748 / NRRL Y-17804) TaxID=698492 RepID=A0A0E9NHQ2_SAICN|nr:SET domain-containing protein [Saitoella complicata NRRL Y-17804]ODQ56041.1 SET domain-containing protein [Saitoella complicata NRRL Y-17804]GAO49387.1 hypothetical protein G7K_3537-t1 [Saitoella complicata NRRL Y-17804]
MSSKGNQHKAVNDPEESEYEVEEIVDERTIGKKETEFKIRWKGYGPGQDSWEPRSNLLSCKDALKAWANKKKRAQSQTPIAKKRKISESISVSSNGDRSLTRTPSSDIRQQAVRKVPTRLNSPVVINLTSDPVSSLHKSVENSNSGPPQRLKLPPTSVPTPAAGSNERITAGVATITISDGSVASEASSQCGPSTSPRTRRRNDIPPTTTMAYPTSHGLVTALTDASPGHARVVKKASLSELQQAFEAKLALLKPRVSLVNEIDDSAAVPDNVEKFEFIERYRFALGITEPDSGFSAGCECGIKEGNVFGGHCDLDDPLKCSCLQEMAEPEFAYDKHGLLTSTDCPIYECNENCGCALTCPNRVVQRGRQLPLEIFKTPDKGFGLRCPQNIKAGTFLSTYTGEVITNGEAKRREPIYENNGATYLFELDFFESELEESGQECYTVDAQCCGDPTRFINHSCDPNLQVRVVLVQMDQRLYHIAFFAIRDIPAYEELTFDYSPSPHHHEMSRSAPQRRRGRGRRAVAGPKNYKAKLSCECKSAKCRGYTF